MKYVEFLEFLGRCAYAKYKDFEDEPMERKLEMLMDEIFPTFSLVRKVVEDEEEELSESDPDYWSKVLTDYLDLRRLNIT